MSALCRFEMLLPLRFNDGREVPRELVSQTISELEERFQGITWESQVLHGRWRHERKSYQDELLRIFVDADASQANRDFFMNALNWLAAEEDLISIRPKPPESQHLNLTAAQMSRILYLGVIGLPLLIVVTGTLVWWGRR